MKTKNAELLDHMLVCKSYVEILLLLYHLSCLNYVSYGHTLKPHRALGPPAVPGMAHRKVRNPGLGTTGLVKNKIFQSEIREIF